ncbi:MAG TPA: fibrinogen-like YCDxxxxGGGW domain-containing protein [Kofleriaceae bacterium]|nr:fibrinogen-like YCDxxxxGGGW domain-containing protein [Kofleriaceae bacterium]
MVKVKGYSIVAMALLVACNITAVQFMPVVDEAGADGAVDAAPGTAGAPAPSCRQLRDALGPISGVYWLRDDASQPAYQAYCEQMVEGGGWAVLYNSVLRLDGTTTAFWNISYADRLLTFGAPSTSDNYYAGSMYRRGTSFLDVITDLDDKDVVAMRADS